LISPLLKENFDFFFSFFRRNMASKGADAELKRAFENLQAVKNASKPLQRQINCALDYHHNKIRQIKLVRNELQNTAGHNKYIGIGRMFVLYSSAELEKHFVEENQHCEVRISELQSKTKEIEANIQKAEECVRERIREIKGNSNRNSKND
ncbi:Prefoldin subunit 1, partial [Trichinella britovi]